MKQTDIYKIHTEHFGKEIIVDQDPHQAKSFNIQLTTPQIELSKEQEEIINSHWEQIVANNPNAKDGQIVYLERIAEQNGEVGVVGHKNGFRRTAYFNRTEEAYDLKDELIASKSLSLSTHSHILCNDNKFMFGTKKKANKLTVSQQEKHQDNISGFGGFPQESDYTGDENFDIVDLYHCVTRGIKGEVGDTYKSIEQISSAGITFVDAAKSRGSDLDFIVRMDTTTKKLSNEFKENNQFTKDTYIVENDPQAMADFFVNQFKSGNIISPYCMGAQVAIQSIIHGIDAGNLIAKAIQTIGYEQEHNAITGKTIDTAYFIK